MIVRVLPIYVGISIAGNINFFNSVNKVRFEVIFSNNEVIERNWNFPNKHLVRSWEKLGRYILCYEVWKKLNKSHIDKVYTFYIGTYSIGSYILLYNYVLCIVMPLWYIIYNLFRDLKVEKPDCLSRESFKNIFTFISLNSSFTS